jgi:hypothetical protein
MKESVGFETNYSKIYDLFLTSNQQQLFQLQKNG